MPCLFYLQRNENECAQNRHKNLADNAGSRKICQNATISLLFFPTTAATTSPTNRKKKSASVDESYYRLSNILYALNFLSSGGMLDSSQQQSELSIMCLLFSSHSAKLSIHCSSGDVLLRVVESVQVLGRICFCTASQERPYSPGSY